MLGARGHGRHPPSAIVLAAETERGPTAIQCRLSRHAPCVLKFERPRVVRMVRTVERGRKGQRIVATDGAERLPGQLVPFASNLVGYLRVEIPALFVAVIVAID